MGHLFISKKHHAIIKEHKIQKGSIGLAAEDLIKMGREFLDMCDTVSEYANEENKTPEGVVKEIFYSAVEYKKFLDKNLPVRVSLAPKDASVDFANIMES